MRKLIVFAVAIAACIAGWLAVEHLYAAAPYENRGPEVAQLGDCILPPPSEDAATVLAGYYEGAAVSDVRLNAINPQEEATTALDVRISPGFKPIYLVVAGSRNSIMRFKGWTRRIKQLVVVTRQPYPVGVTGLPRSKILFAQDCGINPSNLYGGTTPLGISNFGQSSGGPVPPGDMVAAAALAAPDVIGGGYNPAVLTIGSGSVGATIYAAHDEDGGLPEWQRGYARFNPAGVYAVDRNSLVAPVASEPYEQLPGWIGLAQLVRDGKLERIDSDNFRVLAPIHIPAGLYGAEAVTFVVPRDQPDPSGDLGHGKIIRQ